MLKIGFIGFGQAGGMFADTAKKEGFSSLAFNTARIDLQVLEHFDSTERFHLSGYEGAGKDRSIGQEAFDSHKETLLEAIVNKFHDFQVLIPIFALGGGTGSGMAPGVLSLLTESFKEKVIAPLLLFPHDKESLRAKMNTLESFSELTQNEDIGATFIIDNQKVHQLYPSFNLNERYDLVRDSFLKQVKHFNESTEKESKISNLDSMDVLTVLSERGCALFSEIVLDEKEMDADIPLGERLIHSFEYSCFATTDYSHLSKVAFVGEFSEEWTKKLQMDALFEGITTPLEVFYGLYPTQQTQKLSTLSTGLPFPSLKLKTFESLIQENEQQVMKSLSIARSQQYQNNQSWTETLKRKRKATF